MLTRDFSKPFVDVAFRSARLVWDALLYYNKLKMLSLFRKINTTISFDLIQDWRILKFGVLKNTIFYKFDIDQIQTDASVWKLYSSDMLKDVIHKMDRIIKKKKPKQRDTYLIQIHTCHTNSLLQCWQANRQSETKTLLQILEFSKTLLKYKNRIKNFTLTNHQSKPDPNPKIPKNP